MRDFCTIAENPALADIQSVYTSKYPRQSYLNSAGFPKAVHPGQLNWERVPNYPVALEQIREIIRPQPHCLHGIDVEAAEGLVRNLITRCRWNRS